MSFRSRRKPFEFDSFVPGFPAPATTATSGTGRRNPYGGRGIAAGFAARALVVLGSLVPAAGAQDIGFEGPGFSGAGATPTESKPESKLWYNDGSWWGSLWSVSGQAFRIHKLDQNGHLWQDTGVLIESRPTSNSDALWDGSKLYVGSHRFSASGGASGNPILILRYSYDASTDAYALDPGFPVTIGGFSTESMVIDKDSTGTVWAAWIQSQRVFISHTLNGDDQVWTPPVILPGSSSNVTTDDVCSLTHFGGNRIGVLWSDQTRNAFLFAVHADGMADTDWSLETADAGESDDHIHLATDSAGRVFATVKNRNDEIKLLVRSAGTWQDFLVATGSNRLTRPILLLDEQSRTIHVFAAGQDSGMIHEKTSSLDSISFPSGMGTVVIRDASNSLVNNPTSTKQNVDSASGRVVLAAHETTQLYWHHSVPAVPVLAASFSAEPLSGAVPLEVRFTDTSSGSPTSWSWSFGDGGGSTLQHPRHTYATPGIFTVSLTVTGSLGSDTEVRPDLVSATRPPPKETFLPVADARVNEGSSDANVGTDPELRVRSSAGSSYHTYLRFDLSGLGGSVTSAKLRLYCTDGSDVGGQVFETSSTWTETGITWNNRPAATSGQIAGLGAVGTDKWIEFDVSPAVGAPGPVSFLLTSTSSNSALFSSREGSDPPQLVVEVETGGRTQRGTVLRPPVADFTASPVSGSTPLSVSFTDISTDAPTRWSWAFGDGATSGERDPVHVYTTPGIFTVTLRAANAAGSSMIARADLIDVAPAPVVQTFQPLADARVHEASPDSNAGTDTLLRLRFDEGSSYESYLRFKLTDLSGPVISAKLRLFCTGGSDVGGQVFFTTSNWRETSITWNNKPAATSEEIASLGPVSTDTWVEFDVTSAVVGPGLGSFILRSTSSDSAYYSSREGSNPPELVVETGVP